MEKIESLKPLNELKNWESIPFKKVTKSQTTYEETEKYISNKLKVFINEYSSLSSLQEKRLCRDLIDYSLRRFHQYSIQHRFKAFYFENPQPDKKVFEHIIPASMLRNLLLDDKIDVSHALYPPIASISKDNDKKLRNAGLTKFNNDLWHPFKRYGLCGIFSSSKIVDHFGNEIDPNSFTLSDHYSYLDKLYADSQPSGGRLMFEQGLANAPNFARKFIEKVKQEIDPTDNSWIVYTQTNGGDMRIRRSDNQSRNAVTIQWQPTLERFRIATELGPGDVNFATTYEQESSLPYFFHLDETTINENMAEILRCLTYAHEKHERLGRR